eukprot:Hpha_TRINITY_DN16212_c2_g2::TRINITY_DN16212_c2_g2_i1::g.13100::m.13100
MSVDGSEFAQKALLGVCLQLIVGIAGHVVPPAVLFNHRREFPFQRPPHRRLAARKNGVVVENRLQHLPQGKVAIPDTLGGHIRHRVTRCVVAGVQRRVGQPSVFLPLLFTFDATRSRSEATSGHPGEDKRQEITTTTHRRRTEAETPRAPGVFEEALECDATLPRLLRSGRTVIHHADVVGPSLHVKVEVRRDAPQLPGVVVDKVSHVVVAAHQPDLLRTPPCEANPAVRAAQCTLCKVQRELKKHRATGAIVIDARTLGHGVKMRSYHHHIIRGAGGSLGKHVVGVGYGEVHNHLHSDVKRLLPQGSANG